MKTLARLHDAAALALFLSTATAAHAEPTKDQCIEGNEKAQELRRAGKFTAATEQLRLCSSPSCPAMVRSDCNARLDALQKAQPTVAFEIKDTSGHDVPGVTVRVDDATTEMKLDGTALPVDVGEHRFTFTPPAAWGPPASETFVFTEGVQDRRERITLAPAGASTIDPASAAREAAHPLGTIKTVGIVTTGVGVVGVAVGAIFGIVAKGKRSDMVSACTTTSCDPAGHAAATSDRSAFVADGTGSTIGFIAGGALLATGITLVLLGKPPAESPPATAWSVVPSLAPGHAGLLLSGGF